MTIEDEMIVHHEALKAHLIFSIKNKFQLTTECKFQEKDLEEEVVKITYEIVEDVAEEITEMSVVKDMIVIMDTTLQMLINIAV